jgi:hypothetical protein
MKKMKTLMAIAILLFVATNCADDKKNVLSDANKIDQVQNESVMTAQVVGTSFYSEELNYFSAQNIVTLAAVSKDKTEKIRIYINYNNGPTTYAFGKGISNSDNMVYTNSSGDWLAAKTKGKGTITFTEQGDYLKATFSFTGVNTKNKNTIEVTQGEFKVRVN